MSEKIVIDENTSDGFHTFKELYDLKMSLHAALVNEWAKQHQYDTHKSYKHGDGTLCFGGGWFIVMGTLPSGDISNHYPEQDWDQFHCPARETAKEWDGHTTREVIARLQSL
jgi:hypothetical protein